MNLLPPNSSPLERATASALAIDLNPAVIKTLWNPEKCPASLLPWLAWAVSADGWELATTEQMQRDLIANSVQTHRIKGTAGAVKGALAALNINIDLVEWWQTQPKGTPHTFMLTAWANENRNGGAPLSAETYQKIRALVDELKPVRSWYEFVTGSRFTQPLNIASTSNLATLSQFETEIKTPPLEFMQPLAAANTSNLFTLTRVAMEIQ